MLAYIHACMLACVHTYIQTDKQTDRQTDRQTDLRCTGAPWRMTPPSRLTSSAKASVSVCRPFWKEKTPCGPPCVNKRACVGLFASMHVGRRASLCFEHTNTHTRTRTHTHTHAHTRTNTIHAYRCVCVYIAFIHVHPCMQACEQASIYA